MDWCAESAVKFPTLLRWQIVTRETGQTKKISGWRWNPKTKDNNKGNPVTLISCRVTLPLWFLIATFVGSTFTNQESTGSQLMRLYKHFVKIFRTDFFFPLDSQKKPRYTFASPTPYGPLSQNLLCFFKTVWRSQKKEGWLAQKVPVKKIYHPWKFPDFCPWKRFFARAKNQKLAREKKIRAWKKLKKSKNTGVKNEFCPWKKRKRAKKRLSRPLFFSRPKKKTLDQIEKVEIFPIKSDELEIFQKLENFQKLKNYR